MSFPVPLPSTFMPLPLAIMIPFMGMQSGVMAQQFGMNFQYGKRKISAMSNEEFNKLTPQQMQADFANQIKGFIPTFEQSLKDMRPFQRMIFIEMLAAFKEAMQIGIDVGLSGADAIAHGIGVQQHVGHKGSEVPTEDLSHSFLSPIQQRAHIRHGHRQEIEQRYGKPEQETVPVGTRFERTLEESQADTTRSGGTGIVGRGRKAAGQSQRMELKKLNTQLINEARTVRNLKSVKSPSLPLILLWEKRRKITQQKILALEARYRF